MSFGINNQAIIRSVAIFIASFFLVIFNVNDAKAAVSPYCPTPLTATVLRGSSISVNVSSCDGPFNIGMSYGGAGTAVPQHGSFVLMPQESITGNQSVIYTHNGDAANSDSFQLEDENGDLVTLNITIIDDTSPVIVLPTSLPVLRAGVPFSQTLTSTGGTGPYTYTLQSGPIVPGLTLSSSGVISGTPTKRSTYFFTVRSTDSLGQFKDKGYGGNVESPILSLDTTSLTAGQGIPFSQNLSTSGGVAPYIYDVEPPGSTNQLPSGITLSSSGLVSGTTNAAIGSYPINIRITDSSSGPGVWFEVKSFTLNVSNLPTVSIAVSPSSVSEDGATNLTYTVTRSVSSASPLTVNLSTTGTATAGTDYTGNVATVTIPANSTTATVTINPTVDGTVEPDETVTLIVDAGSGYVVGAPTNAVGTILNDDVPSASIAVSPASVSEDGAPNLIYTVTLNQAAFNPISVNFTTGGIATSGTDYAAVTSPLIIATGNTTGTITINPTADASIEADETVSVTLAAGTGYTVGVPNSAVGNILNDDLPNLTINDVTVTEGNSGTTNATFTVSLSAPAPAGGVTFNIATANGTATSGVDYVAQNLTSQTIPAGSSTYSFTVQVNGDALNEPTETFFVNVTGVINSVVVDGQGVGTITNDDPLPSISIDDVTLTEGDSGTSNATLTVSLSAASGQTITVNYATSDGIATSASDYTNTSGTLTFTSGQTSKTVIVPVLGDTTPESSETFSVNLSGATNATIADSAGQVTITNDDIPVTISPTSVPNGTVGVAYSQTISASGGTSPYTYSISAGSLPAGINLSSGGVLSGTPTAGGTFNYTIDATDNSGAPGPFTGSRAYTLTIAAPTISLPTKILPQAMLNTAYSNGINTATGGTSPYTYAISSGGLPFGLNLDSSTGAITGTPTSMGVFNFDIMASDSSTGTGPYFGFQSYSIEVIDMVPFANPVTSNVGYNSSNNSVTLNINAGTPASVAIATSPSHGTVSVSGTSIKYTPTTNYAGPDSFTYTASNTSGTSAPANVTINVADPVITITPSGAFTATAGTNYSQTFTFNGGAQPWSSYQVSNLPNGLSITGNTANSVTISGVPLVSGAFNLNVSATDSSTGNGPYTIGQAFVLNVDAPTISITPASLTNGAVAASYSQTISASGGIGAYYYTRTAGTIPNGLTLSSAGALSGTPTEGGNFNFTISATDESNFSASQSYSINIAAPTIVLPATNLPVGTQYQAYNSAINSATGGTAPYVYSISAGALPTGMLLSKSGTLSGTPTAFGTFTFTINARDNSTGTGPYSASRVFSLQILEQAPIVGNVTQSVGYGSNANNISLNLSGGAASSVSIVTPPTHGSAQVSGTSITYTPNQGYAGADSFSYNASNITGTSSSATVNINVTNPTLTISAASVLNINVGQDYTQTFNFAGGFGPYNNYSITGLPAGLTQTASTSNSVTISGKPSAQGSFTIGVSGSDSSSGNGPFNVSQNFTLNIGAPDLVLSPSAGGLNATYASPYSQSFATSGGIGPYQYSVIGTLPNGISLNSNSGLLSGSSTQSGSFSFAIKSTDTGSTGSGAPFSVQNNYTLNVAAPTIAITPTSPAAGVSGIAYSATLSASGGIGQYTYSVSSGALPTGLVLSTSGQITGTPTRVGAFNFVILARDANGQTGTANLTINIGVATLTITPTSLPNGAQGIDYNQTISVSGGVAPYSFAITSGALPSGLSLNATSGVISGAPTSSGAANFTLTVTDSSGGTQASASVIYNMDVIARPNPVNDAQVRAIVQAQTSSTKRFGSVQINNFTSRLEKLHNSSSGGFDNSLSLSSNRYCFTPVAVLNNSGCQKAVSNSYSANVAGNSKKSSNDKNQGGADGSTSIWSVWANGNIRFGDDLGIAGASKQEFKSEGISFGADRRFNNDFAAGFGFGFGHDNTDIGTNGSKTRGEAKTIALYGSHKLGKIFYIDWLGGYQTLDFDIDRYVTSNGSIIKSNRSGNQYIASVSAGADIDKGNWQFTPYTRLDLTRATLDAYVEKSGSIFDLKYYDQKIDFSSLTLGTRYTTQINRDWGQVLPMFRFEYQYDLEQNTDARVVYYDQISGPQSSIPLTGISRSQFLLGFGTEILYGDDLSIRLEYQNHQSNGSGSDQSVQLGIRKQF